MYRGRETEMTHSTLCWSCENACKKCSWSKNFIPVPGWKAIPTKIFVSEHSATPYIDSFDVYECPEFELLESIKRKLVEKAGKIMPDKKALIRKMYFKDKKKVKDIACELGYSRSSIYKIIGKR
jgi:hypothetical protein